MIATVLASVVLLAPQKKPAPPAPAAPKERWVSVVKWEGNGTLTTDPVVITGKRWRTKWSFTSETGMVVLAVSYVSTKTGQQEGVAFMTNPPSDRKSGTGVSYGYKRGEFAFEVSGANCDWVIELEQLVVQK